MKTHPESFSCSTESTWAKQEIFHLKNPKTRKFPNPWCAHRVCKAAHSTIKIWIHFPEIFGKNIPVFYSYSKLHFQKTEFQYYLRFHLKVYVLIPYLLSSKDNSDHEKHKTSAPKAFLIPHLDDAPEEEGNQMEQFKGSCCSSSLIFPIFKHYSSERTTKI